MRRAKALGSLNGKVGAYGDARRGSFWRSCNFDITRIFATCRIESLADDILLPLPLYHGWRGGPEYGRAGLGARRLML